MTPPGRRGSQDWTGPGRRTPEPPCRPPLPSFAAGPRSPIRPPLQGAGVIRPRGLGVCAGLAPGRGDRRRNEAARIPWSAPGGVRPASPDAGSPPRGGRDPPGPRAPGRGSGARPSPPVRRAEPRRIGTRFARARSGDEGRSLPRLQGTPLIAERAGVGASRSTHRPRPTSDPPRRLMDSGADLVSPDSSRKKSLVAVPPLPTRSPRCPPQRHPPPAGPRSPRLPHGPGAAARHPPSEQPARGSEPAGRHGPARPPRLHRALGRRDRRRLPGAACSRGRSGGALLA